MTFYGGKTKVPEKAQADIICFDDKGKIVASGKKSDMIKYAKEHNYAVAYLVPIKYIKPKTKGEK